MMVYIKFAAFLLVVVLTQEVLGSSFDVSTGEFSNRFCSKCQPEACPEIPEKCPVGLVTDLCGCCTQGVCGVVEGEKCYNVSLEPTLPAENKKYGLCGNNLHCLLRPDLSFRDEPEALCVCKETQVACGSNNKTYDSVCQMNQEAADSGFPNTLYLKHWGPCRSVPWIISGPQDVGSSLGQGLALDCEVKGYPIPSIHWEFKADDGTSRMLPSDDLYMAVQVRGGPEPYMATSWVQIVSFRHKDTGTYTCVATNTEGVVRASAQVGVRG